MNMKEEFRDSAGFTSENDSLSFEELRKKYFLADSEKEKRNVLRKMSKKAATFEDWVFIYGQAKEQNIHCKSEKKMVKTADTISDLVFVIKTFMLTLEKKEYAIKKALSIASNKKDLEILEPICRENFMRVPYIAAKTRIAFEKAFSKKN